MQSSATDLFPVIGFDAGISYQLTRSLSLGADIQASYSNSDRQVLSANLSLAWAVCCSDEP
jgi:hypothetical protein